MNPDTDKLVAVVILNWNGKALMEEFLPSVMAHTPTDIADVIVADNGSADDSIAWLRTTFPNVQILSFPENLGFAEGYNQAISQLPHKYTVLLNSDIEVTEGWLTAPLAAMEGDTGIVAAQPKIRAARKKECFEYAGAAGGFMDIYGYPYCRGRIFSTVEEDRGQYDTEADLLWATGACLFIRTETYKEVGGLDKGFFAHQEEIDLCWRLRSRGHRIVCTPQSVVYHVGGATLHTESPRKTFLNFRNNLLMLYKNLPEKQLCPVMRIRLFLDYLAALRFLLGGHLKNAQAVYEARKAFHQLQPQYRPVREENLQKATCTEIPEIRRKSLLLSYYLQGEKRFDLLS